MHRWSLQPARALLALLVITLTLFWAPSSYAADKSYRISSLATKATLNPDGSMDVHERLTYEFTGSFTFGTRPIPPGGYYSITNMSVSENGKQLRTEGAPNDLKWFFSAQDEQRSFDIQYRVVGATQVGPDVGELYWKWMGTDHPKIDYVNVALTVPSSVDVRAWAHGPLTGTALINQDQVEFDIAPLPAGKFWEGRVTLPASAFTVAPSGEQRLPGILSEEEKWANEANDERNRERRTDVLFNAGSIATVVVIWGWYFYAWRRWGNDPPRPGDVGKYWYEPPAESPAVVLTTLESGDVNHRVIGATIVDLAQRGFVQITEIKKEKFLGIFGEGKDWELTRKFADESTLKPFEQELLAYVFRAGSTVTQEGLEKYSKKHPTESKMFLDQFKESVVSQVEGIYVTKSSALLKTFHFLMCCAGIGVGVSAIFNGVWLGALTVVASLLLMPFAWTMTCRTELGARKAAEWEGLRNYLEDFANFKDAPIGHLILWERYLVYAVGFGSAEKLAKAFAMRYPDIQANAGFATWYVGSSDGSLFSGGGLGSFSGFGSSLSPPSSGSGSGGGSSGGGGGGGGGGGAGAG